MLCWHAPTAWRLMSPSGMIHLHHHHHHRHRQKQQHSIACKCLTLCSMHRPYSQWVIASREVDWLSWLSWERWTTARLTTGYCFWSLSTSVFLISKSQSKNGSLSILLTAWTVSFHLTMHTSTSTSTSTHRHTIICWSEVDFQFKAKWAFLFHCCTTPHTQAHICSPNFEPSSFPANLVCICALSVWLFTAVAFALFVCTFLCLSVFLLVCVCLCCLFFFILCLWIVLHFFAAVWGPAAAAKSG